MRKSYAYHVTVKIWEDCNNKFFQRSTLCFRNQKAALDTVRHILDDTPHTKKVHNENCTTWTTIYTNAIVEIEKVYLIQYPHNNESSWQLKTN